MEEGKPKKQHRKRRGFTDEFKAATVQRVLSGTKTPVVEPPARGAAPCSTVSWTPLARAV